MNSHVLDTRPASVFIAAAATRLSVSPHRAMLNLAFEISKAISGGHWVGGTVTLTEAALEFHPNWGNRRVFRGDNLDIEIPLKGMISVRTDPAFGLGYKVVSVETPKSTFRIKCTDAESFAEKIRAASGA
jgi:hypothetical protein